VVEAELLRLRPGFVSIIGGPAAVAPAVESRLRALGIAVLRTQGADRYDTSARVSAAAFATGARVAYVATGTAFPDALAAGSGAAVEGGPVLLTRPGALPATVAAELRRLAPAEIVVVGGTTAVSAAVAEQLRALGPVVRIAGADRFATAAAVARRVGIPGSGAVVATGLAFPDALSGAWYAARAGRPLLLVQRSCAPEPALRAADDLGVRELTVLGGLSAVGAPVERLAVCVDR
jgi:putative cell wall-binding protein